MPRRRAAVDYVAPVGEKDETVRHVMAPSAPEHPP